MSSKPPLLFNLGVFLDSTLVKKKTLRYKRAEAIFSQGDTAGTVMYIRAGGVKLSAFSKTGREAVVAVLGPGDFFGEGSIAGLPRRMGSATAITPSTIVELKKKEMLRLLHNQPGLAGEFIAYMLAANIRIEGDLIDQLFNHDEKRLARAILVLARYGLEERPRVALPGVSLARLAILAGTTPAKADFFVKKFKKLGFVGGGRTLTINKSLLSVILHE